MALTAVLLLLIISNVALAQNESSVQMPRMQKIAEERKIFVKTDAFYLLLNGFSIGAGMSLSPQASVEVDLQRYRLNESLFRESNHQFTSVAVRGDVWFYQPIEERGFYVSGGISSVTVESKVNYPYTNSNLESKDSKVGGQVMAGYQLDYLTGSDSILRVKFGVGGGNGASVSYTADSTGSKTEVGSGLLLEASAAYYF